MATSTINTIIQLRNDTAANWASSELVMAKAEFGVENDTGLFKIGDGVHKFSELNYANDIDSALKEVGGGGVYIATKASGEDDIAALTRVVGANTLKKGDSGIVKTILVAAGEGTEEIASRTAYTYDGTHWAAMDGNYSADNVYFDQDLVYTVPIGTLAAPSGGQGTFAVKGKSVAQGLSQLMAKEANPKATKPAVSFSTQTGFGTYEIGTKKTLDYAASLSAGSYTYGPATGITAQSWSVSCTGVADPKTTASGSFANVVAEATAKTITATATYNQGAMPKTNMGNDYAAARIPAGEASKTSNQLIGVRYMFYGPLTSDATLNSATIRGLSKKEAAAKKTLGTFGAGAGAVKVVVAVPAGYKVTKVLMPSAMNADATASFVKQAEQVNVEGAEGYTAAAYDVYVYKPASIDSTETYAVTIG